MSNINSRAIALGVVFVAVFALAFAFVPAINTANAASPTCTLSETKDSDLLYDWSNQYGPDHRLLANAGPDARKMPLWHTPVPAGSYKVTIQSFDNHSDHPGQDQEREQWYLQLRTAGHNFVANVGSSVPDIPDNQNYIRSDRDHNAGRGYVVEENYTVTSTNVGYILAHHTVPGGDNAQSVRPVCVLFERLEQPPTACPLSGGTGKIKIDFSPITDFISYSSPDDQLAVANDGAPAARVGSVNTSVPAGNYKVTLASFDDHVGHPGQNQDKEKWFLRLTNNTYTGVGDSAPTPDLPEEPVIDGNWIVNTQANPMIVSEAATKAFGVHAALGDSRPQSVYPVCAVLERIPEPVPTCTLTISPSTVVTGQPATLGWTSENATSGTIQPGNINAVPVELGSTTVYPTQNTTYTGDFTGPGGSAGCSVDITVTDVPKADVTITKSVRRLETGTTHGKSASGDVGDWFLYRLVYRNLGNAPAVNSTIVDIGASTPSGVLTDYEIVNDPEHGTCTATATGITCNLGTLPVGTSDPSTDPSRGVITYKARSTKSGAVHNVVTIDTDTTESNENNNTDFADVSVDQLPATLTLIKVVENDNGGDALPDEFQLEINTVPITSPIPAQSGVPVTLLPGEYAVSETNLPGYTAGSWGGDCTPIGDGTSGTVTLGAGQNLTCTITNDDNDIDLTKDVDKTVGVNGTKFTYTLSYSNNSIGPVDAVTITDTASPAGILGTYNIETQPIHDGTGTGNACTPGLNGITCNLGALPAGATGSVVYSAIATAEGSVDNTACIATPLGEPSTNTANNCDSETVVVGQESLADVRIAKHVRRLEQGTTFEKDATGQVGDWFLYRLVYRNLGNIPAADVTIVDAGAPSGVLTDYEIVNDPEHGTCTATATGITCNLGTLPVGTSDPSTDPSRGVITYKARSVVDGDVHNIAIIDTSTDETNTNNNESFADVSVTLEPLTDIVVEKSVDNATGIKNVTTFTYTLRYFHSPDSLIPAENTTLIDVPTPKGNLIDYTIITQPAHDGTGTGTPCEVVDSEIRCNLGTIPLSVIESAPGEITYTAKATSNLGEIDNEVTIYTDTEEVVDELDVPTNNIATQKVVVGDNGQCIPGQITNTDLDLTVKIGNSVNYEIKWIGTEPITVSILDPLPAGLTFDGVSKITGSPTQKGTSNIRMSAENEQCGGNTVVLEIEVIGSGCSGNCGGGGGDDPDIVLFDDPDNEPLVAGTFIALGSQVPYTGFADVIQVILFLLGLVLVSGAVVYGAFKWRGKRQARLDNHITVPEHESQAPAQVVTPEPAPARAPYVPLSPRAPAPTPAPVAQAAPTPSIVETNMAEAPASSDAAFLEKRARGERVLISEDASSVILSSARGNKDEAIKALDSVIASAKSRYPREDGWLILNEGRVSDIMFSSKLSTVPLFIQWIVDGDEEKIFMFLRTMARQGRASEEFVRKVIYELDTVYQARLEGGLPSTDQAIAKSVGGLSLSDLENIIGSLTRAIDGGYQSPLVGVKVALARVLEERKASRGKAPRAQASGQIPQDSRQHSREERG